MIVELESKNNALAGRNGFQEQPHDNLTSTYVNQFFFLFRIYLVPVYYWKRRRLSYEKNDKSIKNMSK